MAPPLLTLKDIHLTFGGTPLLEGAELTVAPGDRICLVGRNGSGKSTLLKIAAGLAEPDRGERFAHPGASIRYLPQEADFNGFETVRAYVEAGLGPTDDHYMAEYLLSELGALRRCRSRTAIRRRSPPRRPRPCSRRETRRSAARRADEPSRPDRHRVARSRRCRRRDRRCC